MPDDMYEDYEEQIAFQYTQQQPRHHRDVQQLTNTTNAALPNRSQRAAAQRQAETEARQRNVHANSRVPPDGLPRGRGHNHDTDDATAQPPRSTLRHRPINGADLEAIPGVQFHTHNEPFIPRSTLVRGLPQGTYYQQQVDTGDIEEDEQETQRPQPPKRGRTRVRWHPLVYLGAGMIVMGFLWIAITYATIFVQTTLNDWHYSRPRTYQTDAVVGHGDSQQNPSHFIAVNLNRHALVIEVPGGDPSKARIYPITTLFGDGQDLTPVTLSFKDVNGKGLLDMEIHIQDQTLVMINENGSFRPLKPGLSQSASVPATGRGHQDPKQATGTITFYNGQLNSVFIPAGTPFTGNDGTQIVTDQDATIPSANPPIEGQASVPAHAVNAGTQGNIPARDINTACCATAVLAVNLTPFQGGANERNFQFVTKSDIENAAIPLKAAVSQSVTAALQAQLKDNEQLQSFPCAPQVSADHQINEEATSVKVTATLTCGAVAYNQTTLQQQATQLLTTQAFKKLGPGYSLFGTIQVTVTHATPTRTIPTLVLSLTGTWTYALSSAAQQRVKDLVKGKTYQEALHILRSLPGIEKASLAWDKHTKLPEDPQDIHLLLISGI